jgi:hypothetical protein
MDRCRGAEGLQARVPCPLRRNMRAAEPAFPPLQCCCGTDEALGACPAGAFIAIDMLRHRLQRLSLAPPGSLQPEEVWRAGGRGGTQPGRALRRSNPDWEEPGGLTVDQGVDRRGNVLLTPCCVGPGHPGARRGGARAVPARPAQGAGGDGGPVQVGQGSLGAGTGACGAPPPPQGLGARLGFTWQVTPNGGRPRPEPARHAAPRPNPLHPGNVAPTRAGLSTPAWQTRSRRACASSAACSPAARPPAPSARPSRPPLRHAEGLACYRGEAAGSQDCVQACAACIEHRAVFLLEVALTTALSS